MNTAICTLFEGDYHHGVAVLTNSLVRNGFTGKVYAGYRGALPDWAGESRAAPLGTWANARTLKVTTGCDLVFLPLETSAHFANIKPDFMLDLIGEPALKFDHLLYLDPDICLIQNWQFMQDWMSCGVAVCEDVNSPVSEHHPRRVGWRRHFEPRGISLRFRGDAYVNSGCVGVARKSAGLLENWKRLGQHMSEVIGGLGVAKLENGSVFSQKGFASCFECTDQDVLNAAMQMTDDVDYSILPRAAMAFEAGELVIPHAVGRRKPWRMRYLREGLNATSPTAADKAFWQFADAPLQSMPMTRIRSARISLKLASALARIYSRQ